MARFRYALDRARPSARTGAASCSARCRRTKARTAARSDKYKGRAFKRVQVARVPREPEVAVQNPVRTGALATMIEVHEQEGEVIQRIDRGDLFVELDRVEENRCATPQDDIAKVQVAVDTPHEAATSSLDEDGLEARDLLSRALAECLDAGSVNEIGVRRQLTADVVGHVRETLRPVDANGDRRRAMVGDDRLGQPMAEAGIEITLVRDRAQEIRLCEPPHADAPFDRVPFAANGQTAVCCPRDRDDIQVDAGGVWLVDFQLAQADAAA